MEAAETSTRRSRRTRFQIPAAEKASDFADGSPERENYSDEPQEELRPQSKRSKTAETSAHIAEQSLIEVIKGNGKFVPQAAKLWVERYEKDPKPAMVELLSMLFAACGVKYYIKEEFLDETDVDEVVVALVSLAKRGEVEDYQTSKKKEMRNFKDNLLTFWDNLIVECQNGPLFDNVLFDKCIDYIIALSCTPPRVYRQGASLMGLQLVTSFITVAKALGVQRETTQRQLNAEKKKRTEGPRVESLEKRLSTTHENITVIEEMMRKIFTGLFVHRYRDIDPNIRMSCIESLGVWILSYPSLFLQDLYLKYLGWTLNDKHAGVRKASVIALQNLYEVDDNVPTLGLFTERFSNRMIDLADDIDVSVAVCAIGLVKRLLRHQLLPDDDLGPLYDLLIDDPADVRHAIGALVYDHLIAQKNNSKGNDGSSSEIHIGRMLQILREFSTEPILSMYVIDDVWEYMKAMKDWKCIISMLVDGDSTVELTDGDATNLVRLLSASVKKAVGERIVPASDHRKQHHTKAQKEMLENHRKDITIAMMKNYPQLLRKFLADQEKIPSLLEIIVYMNLELYSLKRQEKNFKATLKLMKEAFFRHSEKNALRSCIKAINFCALESQGELQDFARNQLKQLEDELVSKVKSAIKEVEDAGDASFEDDDDKYSLLVNSKRLYELQLSRPAQLGSLFEDFSKILESSKNIGGEVTSLLLVNMHLHVCYSLHSVVTSETVSAETVSTLLSRRTVLFKHLESFLEVPSTSEVDIHSNQLACRVSNILAELWICFRKDSFSSTVLENLGYSPDEFTCQKYWRLCEKQLDISDETDEEDGNKEYIEENNRDAIIISAAKLVVNDTIPKEYLAPDIISHYTMHGASVAEIVKHFVTTLRKKEDDLSSIILEALKKVKSNGSVSRELDKMDIPIMLLREKTDLPLPRELTKLPLLAKSTTIVFLGGGQPELGGGRLELDGGCFNLTLGAHNRYAVEVDKDGDQSTTERLYQDCKDLANRLSSMYVGTARNKHRLEILQIVKNGIIYAFIDAPKQLTFLECSILYFASKLHPADILEILKDVERRIENVDTDEDPSGWRPCLSFVETLQEKCSKNEPEEKEKTVKRRGRPRKKHKVEGRRLFEEHSTSEEEEEAISSSDQENDADKHDDHEEDDDMPLIRSIRSSAKLRSMKVPRDHNQATDGGGNGEKASENLGSSRTSGASN